MCPRILRRPTAEVRIPGPLLSNVREIPFMHFQRKGSKDCQRHFKRRRDEKKENTALINRLNPTTYTSIHKNQNQEATKNLGVLQVHESLHTAPRAGIPRR